MYFTNYYHIIRYEEKLEAMNWVIMFEQVNYVYFNVQKIDIYSYCTP